MELGHGWCAGSLITPSGQMASWEFARPEWWHCSSRWVGPPSTGESPRKLNNHLFFGNCPFSVSSTFLPNYFQKRSVDALAERQMEHESGENPSVPYCSSSFFKKWQLSEIQFMNQSPLSVSCWWPKGPVHKGYCVTKSYRKICSVN